MYQHQYRMLIVGETMEEGGKEMERRRPSMETIYGNCLYLKRNLKELKTALQIKSII